VERIVQELGDRLGGLLYCFLQRKTGIPSIRVVSAEITGLDGLKTGEHCKAFMDPSVS
jgi:hypothetical protein